MKSQPGRNPVTLHDVAREAGVSLATASRSLNGSTRKVNDTYRDLVLAAAAKLQYTPNLSAQAVAKGATSTIALLVSDIADPYFSTIASGVIHAAEAEGLIVTMAVTERSTSKELELVRALRGQRPRIMILTGSRLEGQSSHRDLVAELDAFESTGGKVVMISQHELPYATVLIDNYRGARELAKSLVAEGYTRFAAVAGIRSLLTSNDRLSGFADGLAEHGIAIHPDHIVRGEFTRDGGYAAAQALLETNIDGVQLVFAVNDVMAVGVMSALRDGGRAVPSSIAVAGYDDIPMALDLTPALTTVNIPLEEVGRRAVELALIDPLPAESTQAAEADPNVVTISTTVVLRQSTPSRRLS